MAKKIIKDYVFHPGISRSANLYPNAYALLTANKTFIQDQLVAFINNEISEGNSPFNGFLYSEEDCRRDAGYAVDAYAHDLRYGGNIETRNLSSYFWRNGVSQLGDSPAEDVAGQNYINSLINTYIFTNTSAPTFGQTDSVQQTLDNNAETGAAARITALVSILTNVMTNGDDEVPEKEFGVGTIKVLGKFNSNEILLITNTDTNNIIYNFSDTNAGGSFVIKQGRDSTGEYIRDLDWPTYSQATDGVTSIYLEYDTSSMSASDSIQVFSEEEYQTIRPWDFGTDAIERMRVATPQAMLDADFEYGLQPTKWQAIALQRSYPSIYEVPGTDIDISSVITDASSNSGDFGSSLITVTTPGPHNFSVGDPITVKGLSNNIRGFGRAEGSFLVFRVPTANTFTYYSQAKVGQSDGQELVTNFTQIRKGAFYTGSSIGTPTFSVESNGTNASVTSRFNTPTDSTFIAFTGTAPTIGSPISGSSSLVPGSSITGVADAGANGTELNIADDVAEDSTSITLTDSSGLSAGMAIDNSEGDALFITAIDGNTVDFSGPYTSTLTGSNGTNTGVSGSNVQPIGEDGTFNVSRSAGAYTVFDAQDSSKVGQNYAVNDRILVTGDNLGGATPANDLTIIVTEIDSGGAITSFDIEGTSISGGDTYTNVNQDSTTGAGINFRIDVDREGGSGNYTVSLFAGGSGHAQGDVVTFVGTDFGGTSPDNDITIRVDGVSFATGAVVNFTVLSGTGVTGDADYTGVTGSLVTPSGGGSFFTITRQDGSYSVSVQNGGSGYNTGDKILIPGSALGGTTGTNDAIIVVTAVDQGAITDANVSGTPYEGDSITFFSSLTLSDALIGSITNGTTLNVGAIATITIDFDSDHGLVPGSSLLIDISSNPPPAFSGADGTITVTGDWRGIVYGEDRFVAIESGSNIAAHSTTGETWTASTMPSASAWEDMAYGEVDGVGYFVAVGDTNEAAYSTDGISWTASTLPSSGTWNGVAYGDGAFVAVRNNSTAAAYSTDGGQTWTSSTLPTTSNWRAIGAGTLRGVTYFVTFETGGTDAAYSINGGQSWTSATAPASATWRDIEFGLDRFVAVAEGTATSGYSTDGINWSTGSIGTSADWNSVAFDGTNYVAVARGSTNAATTFDGVTWSVESMESSSGWDKIAFGTPSGENTFVAVSNTDATQIITLASANHELASGPFYVSQVPGPTEIRYTARTTGIIDTNTDMTGVVYSRPDTFFTHRPFDGGVQLGTGGPAHGAQAVRQSKKYIRYQSGKGIMYTTGALFAPNYNLLSATAQSTAANSLLTITTDDTNHNAQVGGVIVISGISTSGYNGEYTIESIVDERSFRVRSSTPVGALTASLGPEATMSVKNWHGATVRTGPFDDQNGIFFQFDGIKMAVVKRSSTFQLAGTIAVNTDSNSVVGTDTRFQDQLKVGDPIVIRGMSHTVTSITDQQNLTISPDFRGAVNVSGAKIALTLDEVIPQEEWNLDKLDGNGPSGYNLDPTKMQMIGVQYTWYAAGFIEFMLRGADGKFIIFHRIRNSNNRTEAYMRTANLPVRYDVKNEGARDALRLSIESGDTTLELFNGYYFPTNGGTIMIDNELISYTTRSGNTLSGLTRSANLSNFAGGSNRTYSAGDAVSHSAGAGVILVSTTVTPVISHWGSALLTDGLFDDDRGYLFSYSANGISVTTTRETAFLIRLAPSVSNAIVGDLGERELVNRAQLLLDSLEITSDGTASDDTPIRGGIVIEGILNPQNYPINPANIGWGGLSGLAQGGQPSFAQIAGGGSVDWNGGASLTTATATVSGDIDTGFVYTRTGGFNDRFSPVPLNYADYVSAGPILVGAQIFSQNPNAFTGSGGDTYVVTRVEDNGVDFVQVYYQDQFGGTTANNQTNASTELKFVFSTYEGITNRLLFTQASWVASGATVGTSVAASDTNWPAGTAVSNVNELQLGGTIFYEVTFSQTSVASISADDTVTFEFGNPAYAQPGETVFSFIAVPGERATLTLDKLKELTNTTIGGRGTFPNGPDVLAINVYKVSGEAVNANIVLKWSEAQA